jgi:RNA polymerase sigma factor (sigma-70 family)
VDTDNSAVQAVVVQEVQQGASPPAGLGEFFKACYRDLIAFTMYIGANEEQAKDAVAGASVDLVGRWDRVDEPLAWMRTAVVSHFLREKTGGQEGLRNRLVERRAGTAERFDDPQFTVWKDAQWVRQMLRSLAPKQAHAIVFLMKEFAYAEIAELLGGTRGAVTQRLAAAGKRLEKALSLEGACDPQPVGARSSFGKKA